MAMVAGPASTGPLFWVAEHASGRIIFFVSNVSVWLNIHLVCKYV